MKRFKVGLLIAALVACLLMAVGCSDVSEGLEYALTEDGSAYVVTGSGSCTDEHLRIPSTYDGKPVVGIADEAFFKCADLEQVEIPTGVISIGRSAFSWCSKLTRVEIPEGVTVVEDQAFAHCKSLTEVKIPDSVKQLGDSAFADCVALSQLHIPAGVTSIGTGVCYGCTAMTDMTVAEGNPAYHADGNCLIETASGTLIAGCKDSVIPSDGSVTRIGVCAFLWCTTLTDLEIPEGIVAIDDSAFSCCKGLTDITIPDSVTEMGQSVFYGCTALTNATLSEGVTCIREDAFRGCFTLTDISISKHMVEVAGGVFSDTAYYADDSNWTNNVLYIGSALIECKTEKSGQVAVRGGTTCIADSAFSGCAALTSLTLPNSVTDIGNSAFSGCAKLTSVNIPDSVTAIGKSVFATCKSLTSITFTGTKTQWESISKGDDWEPSTDSFTIHCTDGDIIIAKENA